MVRSRKQAQGARAAQTRALLAQEAARLISEHGIRDRRQALRKAMQRLGIADEAAAPRPEELDQALREHQRLFGGTAQADALRERRAAALQAMRLLEGYEPRLVGAVLDGTADQHSAVQLHVFTDDADELGHFLDEHGIPHRVGERSVRVERDQTGSFPLRSFIAGGIDFELLVLPRHRLRQAPFERDGSRSIARANAAAVRQLLESNDAAGLLD